MTKQETYSGYLSSRLLMMVVLAFCLFDTSGHIISSVQVLPAFQVELTLKDKDSFNEKELCFFEANTPSPINDKGNVTLSLLFDSNYLIAYDTLVSIKYQSLSQRLNIFKAISHFTQLKRIPQNSDEPFKS